ncbi:MAG: tautomerase family protein [Methanobacterium sp.]|uniref:4-oxalocrotonate tautomerase DmpI n=1 Tax=Methanobacterium sp. TaxID=2164 RepID=UPI003D64FFFD|nr:tautomerase family protein [Methanobacterium sp.]
MPVITMEVGKLEKEQKKNLVKKFTKVASEITGIDKQYLIVVIREWPDENLGINGLTVEEIKSKMEN